MSQSRCYIARYLDFPAQLYYFIMANLDEPSSSSWEKIFGNHIISFFTLLYELIRTK